MASLVTNGVSPLSPQPVSELSKGSLFHVTPKSPVSGNPNSRAFLKIRADVSYESKTTIDSPEIDPFSIPKGLSEETIRLISSIKNEPDWMLDFRLKSYEKFVNMKEPKWSDNQYRKIDFQDICYYSESKKKPSLNSLDEADPELIRYFDKLGVPLNERNRLANVAVDAVLDSFSIAATHRKTLEKAGVIFCSISEAIREYPELIRKYLGRTLNSAVFSDGSFVYIPKNTKCPMQISTYFRINDMETGQFERTLIVADEGSFVEYLEGCTAPSYDTNQLHDAVVELYCHVGTEIKYSMVQNWYAGDEKGRGGIYNFVTKRGLCAGAQSKISWTQVETGSAITWKYPSVVLEGDESVGEFYSVALTNNYQQADTGTEMIHKGKNTKSRIISKGISAGHSRNCYRGLIQVMSNADNAQNSSQCDSMLIGNNTAPNTYPYIQRGIDYEKAMAAMISGFCQDVFNKLPDEFGAEVNQLMSLKLEGSVG
ncbi:hypothetical protein Pfo_023240 [Paulownia fortunei]|nr:hypothetical protein Pfo_023240 [Paulownia fortunei]